MWPIIDIPGQKSTIASTLTVVYNDFQAVAERFTGVSRMTTDSV